MKQGSGYYKILVFIWSQEIYCKGSVSLRDCQQNNPQQKLIQRLPFLITQNPGG